MKKIALLIACIVLSTAGFCTGDKFKVTGTIEGMESGKVLLVGIQNNERKTLAEGPIVNYAFELEGEVEGLLVATLTVEGARGGMPIFLEAGNYEVVLGRNSSVTGGGITQQVGNKFSIIHSEGGKKQMELRQQYGEAQQAQDEEKMRQIYENFEKLSAEMLAQEDVVIKENPDSDASVFYLYATVGRADFETLNRRFALLGEKGKASDMGKEIAAHLEKMKTVAIGAIAPDFTLETPEGGQISLHGVKAKVKLIDFWASWCGPCRAENPHVVAIYNEYHPKGLEILGVSLDRDKAAWLKAIEDDGLIWKHGSDLQHWQSAPAKLYLVNGIPHTVLLDENNRIIAKDLRGDALKAKIAELLD